MTTRREFIGSLSAFAVASNMLGEGTTTAQAAAPVTGHFHPKGKAPSKFTIEVLKKAKAESDAIYTRALPEDHPDRIAIDNNLGANLLDLGRLDGVTRDPVRYPLFPPTMIDSMRTEVTLLVEDLVTCVVQVAGKVRERLEVPPGITEDELRELALASPGLVKALDGRAVRTVIVRPPKLVNVVPA